MIVSTHRADVLERAHRCVALYDGSVSYDGPPGSAGAGLRMRATDGLGPRAARGGGFARCYRAPPMAAPYDLMLLLDPNAPEGRDEQILGDVEQAIAAGGSLIGRHDWGLRRMTFEIDHRPEADYYLFQFEGDVPLLDRLNHMLKITDGVLRFRIIKLRAGTPPPPDPKPEAARAREPRGSERVAARAAADAG